MTWGKGRRVLVFRKGIHPPSLRATPFKGGSALLCLEQGERKQIFGMAPERHSHSSATKGAKIPPLKGVSRSDGGCITPCHGP